MKTKNHVANKQHAVNVRDVGSSLILIAQSLEQRKGDSQVPSSSLCSNLFQTSPKSKVNNNYLLGEIVKN